MAIEWIYNFFTFKKEPKNLYSEYATWRAVEDKKKNIRILANSFATANRKISSENRFIKISANKAG